MDSDSESISSSFSTDDDDYDEVFVASATGYEDDAFYSVDHLPDVIGPYMYEPEAPPANSATAADVEDDIDVGILQNWCSCQFCQVLPTQAECVCCHQIEIVSELLPHDEDRPIGCITERRGFDVVCLDKDVLDVAWLQYKQQYGRQAYDGPLHKRLRHVAYRQFVRWCYRYLGKDIRVILPSCVVSKIRAFFPPPGLEENVTFEGFHFD